MAFGDNLTFKPLHWIFHDQWSFRTWYFTLSNNWVPVYHFHRGHVHFFMPGHNASISKQAYSGSQVYTFRLSDSWSPRTTHDPNQTNNLRIVSTPKWYFYIKEFWRRVYIQDWEDSDNGNDDTIVGKKGIGYDASLPIHTYGPFRESRGNFFYWNNMARTLPIEYWHDEDMTIRDHVVRTDVGAKWYKRWSWNTEAFDISSKDADGNPSEWIMPRTILAGQASNHSATGDGPSDDNPARRFGYADSNYIYPTIEYQSVVHSDWERYPYPEDRDISADEFGDGFQVSISIPWTDQKSGIIQSPFSDDTGDVGSPGTYYHGFETKHPDHTLKYAATNVDKTGNTYGAEDNVVFDPQEWIIPSGQLGQSMSFNVPAGYEVDGTWVEQCLGAIVMAKALVTVEDNFGKRYEIWVTDSSFINQDNFSGKDQNAPE